MMDLLNSKNSDDVKKILCRKADVPGFQQPTYVINYDECIDLIDFLPKQRVKHVRGFINKQFKRVRAGDQSLHAEVDARAVNGGTETLMAQQALGLSPQAATVTNEDRVLKRRRDELEIEGMETKLLKTQYDFMNELFDGKLEERDKLRFADRVRNIDMNNTKQLTNGESYVITVSARCQARGLKSLVAADWKAIGKIASRMYTERAIARGETDPVKQKPPKHKQEAMGGSVHPVNTYMAPDDLPLIDAAIDEYLSEVDE